MADDGSEGTDDFVAPAAVTTNSKAPDHMDPGPSCVCSIIAPSFDRLG